MVCLSTLAFLHGTHAKVWDVAATSQEFETAEVGNSDHYPGRDLRSRNVRKIAPVTLCNSAYRTV